MTRTALILALLLLGLCAQPAPCPAQDRPWLPEPLARWEGWVLHGQEGALCPPLATDPSRRQCLFPTRLSLAVDASGASFAAVWRVFAPSAVPLPWGQGLWPEDVKVFGKPAPVLADNKQPVVRLEPGEWQVTGRIAWRNRPRHLNVPPQVGVLELSVDKAPVARPAVSADGRVEITGQGPAAEAGDSLRVTVMRLLRDGVPLRVVTLARLEVSGRSRVIDLDGLLLPGTEPMAVRSPVPAGFGPQGRVSVLAGAGRHDVEVESRFTGNPASIGPLRLPFGDELWALEPDQALRELLPSGLAPVDARTSDLPEAWKRHQAFQARDGATLALATARRGEPPAHGGGPAVVRRLWLDADGRGLTAQDRLEGGLDGAWSLSMTPPGELGRVTQGARDLPVVLLGADGPRGVVLRQSAVDLTAEARYPDRGAALPASGWNGRVSSLSAVLELPPGWALFRAAGPDAVSDSWVGRWTLLDVFLALLIPLCAWKLGRPRAALALLGFLALGLHEEGAPVWQWLPLLAALGIGRAAGALRGGAKAAGFLRGLALIVLAIAALPFVLEQARTGLYPQLAAGDGPVLQDAAPAVHRKAAPAPAAKAPTAALRAQEAPAAAPAPDRAANAATAGRGGLEHDPASLVQTGPGLPAWSGTSVRLGWTGPVEPGERLSLTFIPPGVNTLLHFARAALLLLAFGLLARPVPAARPTAALSLLLPLLAALGAALGAATPAAAADYPSAELLGELRVRLLKPAECQPHCAGVSRLAVALDAETLTMTLTAGAAARLALPLPSPGDGWRPGAVLVDGKPAALFGMDGGPWVLLEPGAHTVSITGPSPRGTAFTIASPLPPRMVQVAAPGFSVLGVGPDGALEGGLRFTRLDDAARGGAKVPTAVVKPFVEVERALTLGLEWSVTTTVRRLTGTGEPVTVPVRLLPGESVTSQDVRVQDGVAMAVLGAGQERAVWRSRLDKAPELALAAQDGEELVEVWRLSASPVWEIAFSGLAPVATRDAAGRYAPVWRPWPGETLRLSIVRPAPAPGESLTIDMARLSCTPGERTDQAQLDVRLRSALGGRQVIRLPGDAQVTDVALGGQAAPWTAQAPGEVALTVPPGARDLRVAWRQPSRGLGVLAAPAVDLGHGAANARVTLEVPRDRLVLRVWGDTPFAPAVTLWGALAGMALAALALGRVPFTPLRWPQWLLLGLGLTQVEPLLAAGAAAWLLALGWRRGRTAGPGWLGFDLLQALLAALVLAGLGCLFEAVRSGLLGDPALGVTGNGSTPWRLEWAFGRTDAALPPAGAFTVAVWWYRGLMLAWSLWLAWSLTGWLRWGWESFGAGGAWRKPVFRWPFGRRGASNGG